MKGMHPMETLVYILLFGGIFALVVYGFGQAIREHFKPRPRDPEAPPSRETPTSILLGIAAGIFLLFLFGSLLLSALGFSTWLK